MKTKRPPPESFEQFWRSHLTKLYPFTEGEMSSDSSFVSEKQMTLNLITNKEMIRGAGSGFGSNCRRYYFMTNNETRVLGFLWMGLFSEIQAILCLKWTIFDKNGVSLVIAFWIFHSYKWAGEFTKEGKKSFNLSYVSLKNVDFKKSYRLLKIE